MINSKELLIEPCGKEGIERVHRLANAIWPGSFEDILTSEQISYMMDMMYSIQVLEKEVDRGVVFYILSFNGEDIGYTAVEKKDATTYKLHKIYLSQKMQGKGLGKFQLHSMEKVAKENGATALLLNVNRGNKALEFYKSQGYEIIKTEDIDIGSGYFMNDYVMKKQL